MPSFSVTALKARLRPLYNSALTTWNPRGVECFLNKTHRFRLSAAFRPIPDTHEPDVWSRLVGEVRPGDVVADVGASIGLYTLGFASNLKGQGTVISFEPDFASYQVLRQNIDVNGWAGIVCPINAAVGEHNGVLRFVSGEGPTSHAAGPEETATVSVACVSLDRFFDSAGIVPDVMKIDVEGLEELVLRGAQRLLAGQLPGGKRPRFIYLDVHPWAWPKLGLNTTNEKLTSFLTGCGYTVNRRNDEYADIYAVIGG